VRAAPLAGVALAAALTGAGAVQATPTVAELGPVAPAFSGPVPVQTLTSYGARGMHVIGYEHRRSTRMTLALHNSGLLPLTVTSLDLPGGVAPLLDVTEVEGLPLSLAPGERGRAVATVRLDNCRFSHEREVETHDGLRVGVRVLGVTSVRTVPFDRPLLVHSPMIVGCPDRKLHRQAADRTALSRAS
jgi:hypothetical protein